MSRIEIKKFESNHKWWVKYVQWKLNQIGGNLSQIVFQDMIQIESENMSLIRNGEWIVLEMEISPKMPIQITACALDK